jgi:hypothetical protein
MKLREVLTKARDAIFAGFARPTRAVRDSSASLRVDEIVAAKRLPKKRRKK